MSQSETYWMKQALAQAEQAQQLGEVPVGAVLVLGDQLVAQNHNRVETKHDASCHAEMLVIQEASAKLGRWRLSEASLYVTLEPCPMCIGAIVLSRISNLYFGAWDPRMGACGSRFDLSSYPEFPHKVQVFPELLKEECQSLLKTFFQGVR